MHKTKELLIVRNGLRCMGCGKIVEYKDLHWHHLKPKYVSKINHEPPDDSYENGSLLCRRCHIEIHKYLWWEDEFQVMTSIVEGNKQESST